MSDCNRREFVIAGAAACAASWWTVRGSVVIAVDEAKSVVDVGELAQFGKDGAVDTWAGKHRFFVVRHEDRLFAVSATCTHKQSLLRAENDEKRFFCPKHEGTFELTGKLIQGKPSSSLPRLGITLDGAGHVLVDPAKEFGEKEWDKPGSFIAIPAKATA